MKTTQKFSIHEKQFVNYLVYIIWDPRSEDSNDAERR